MRHVKCVVIEQEEMGIVGLVPVMYLDWFNNGAFVPARQLGHELIAHRSKEDGSLECELQALGCEMWLSNFWNFYNSGARSNEERFASELSSTISDYQDSDETWSDSLKPFNRKFRFEHYPQVRKFFWSAFSHVKKTFPVNFCYTNEDKKDFKRWLYLNSHAMLQHIAYGYWHASSVRYRNHDAWDIYRLRERLNEKTPTTVDEGQEFTISYDLKGTIIVTEHK